MEPTKPTIPPIVLTGRSIVFRGAIDKTGIIGVEYEFTYEDMGKGIEIIVNKVKSWKKNHDKAVAERLERAEQLALLQEIIAKEADRRKKAEKKAKKAAKAKAKEEAAKVDSEWRSQRLFDVDKDGKAIYESEPDIETLRARIDAQRAAEGKPPLNQSIKDMLDRGDYNTVKLDEQE